MPQVYSGNDLDSEELIGEYEGNMNQNLPTLVSHHNRVRVKFKSDNYLQYKGFSLQYSVYRPSPSTTEQQSEPEDKSLAPGSGYISLYSQ